MSVKFYRRWIELSEKYYKTYHEELLSRLNTDSKYVYSNWQAARYLGFSKNTFRNWDIPGHLVPCRSPGNYCLYTSNMISDSNFPLSRQPEINFVAKITNQVKN